MCNAPPRPGEGAARFTGIGVGPGDPELLTCRASKVLGTIDRVAVPVATGAGESTALKIAAPHLRPGTAILKVEFPMTRDREQLERAWQEGADSVSFCLAGGEKVAFLTLGDPMLYSTYIYLYRLVKKRGFPVETIPGISAFTAAAATAGVPLAVGDESVALLPAAALKGMDPGGLDPHTTLVLFKVASRYGEIVDFLAAAGRLGSSVLVADCSQPGERVITDLCSMGSDELPYFSLIISRGDHLP